MISKDTITTRAQQLLAENPATRSVQLGPDAHAIIQSLIEAITNTRPEWPPYPAELEPMLSNSNPITYAGWQCTITMPRHNTVIVVPGTDPKADYEKLMALAPDIIPQAIRYKLTPLARACATALHYDIRDDMPHWDQ